MFNYRIIDKRFIDFLSVSFFFFFSLRHFSFFFSFHCFKSFLNNLPIVIDRSVVPTTSFPAITNFMRRVTSSFVHSEESGQTAIITFGTDAKIELNLESNAKNVDKTINGMISFHLFFLPLLSLFFLQLLVPFIYYEKHFYFILSQFYILNERFYCLCRFHFTFLNYPSI